MESDFGHTRPATKVTSTSPSTIAPNDGLSVYPRPTWWKSKRGLIAVATVFLAVALGLGAIQTWRIVSAIVTVQQAAVVPLPTRNAEVAQGLGIPSASNAEAPAPPATPRTEPADDEPTQSASTGDSVTTDQEATQADSAPSRFDVVVQLVEAGINDGDPGLSSVWQGQTDLNILVLGVDRRPDGGDQNADVIIIAHVDLVEKRVAAVSIPRDLLVDIPVNGPDKINAAYNDGVLARPDDPVAGVAKMRDTIESVFGVPIDGYVMLDFDGFTHVIDAVGGVEVDVPYAIYDDAYPTEDYGVETVQFDQGLQTLDGETALKYVRTRHADSDDARRERQFQLLLSLFSEGQSIKSITRADRIILALGDSVQTSFPLEQQLTLARVAYQTEESDIRLTTLGQPVLVEGYTEDGRWVYTGDMTEIVAMVHRGLETRSVWSIPGTT